jgi:transposase
MDNDNVDERRRQIEALLTYPKVGPLSAAAIAANLADSEIDVRAALASLLQEGKIVPVGGDRFAGTSSSSPGRTASGGETGLGLGTVQ